MHKEFIQKFFDDDQCYGLVNTMHRKMQPNNQKSFQWEIYHNRMDLLRKGEKVVTKAKL